MFYEIQLAFTSVAIAHTPFVFVPSTWETISSGEGVCAGPTPSLDSPVTFSCAVRPRGPN